MTKGNFSPDYKCFTIEGPQDIGAYVSSIKCTPQTQQSVACYSRTTSEDSGNSASIAVVGGAYLEMLGYRPQVMSFITDGSNVRDLKFVSTPVYQDEEGQYRAIGIATPNGMIGNDVIAGSLENMARILSERIRKSTGDAVKKATIADLTDYDNTVGWRGDDECSHLLHALARASTIYNVQQAPQNQKSH